MSEPVPQDFRLAAIQKFAAMKAMEMPADAADQVELLRELQIRQIELEMETEALRQSLAGAKGLQAKYNDVCDLVPVGVYSVSVAGQILEVNTQGLLFFDAPEHHVVGKQFRMFFKTEALAPLELLFTLARQSRKIAAASSLQLRRINGFPLYVDALARQYKPPGEMPGIRIVLSDVSALKNMRDDVIRSLDKASGFGALGD